MYFLSVQAINLKKSYFLPTRKGEEPDEIMQSIDDKKHICFDFLNLFKWGTEIGPDWIKVADNGYLDPQYPYNIYKDWAFKKEEEELGIDLFLSNEGHAAPMEQLLSCAIANQMGKIFFVKGPENLGQISIIDEHPQEQEIAWVYYNAFVDIKLFGSSLDIKKLAFHMQAQWEGHVVEDIEPYKPRFLEVENFKRYHKNRRKNKSLRAPCRRRKTSRRDASMVIRVKRLEAFSLFFRSLQF